MIWKLADAKNKFSQVVDMALGQGPQKVTRRDDAVIVVAAREFERLSKKKWGFKDYLMKAPSLKDIHFDRDGAMMRKVSL